MPSQLSFRLFGPVACAVLAAAYASDEPTAGFASATVKASDGKSARSSIGNRGGAFSADNANLAQCIEWAYDVKDYQILGPSWLRNKRGYDIRAVAPPQNSWAEMKTMVQTLLADRFRLKTHRETRIVPVLTLMVDEGGPKIHTSDTKSSNRTNFQKRAIIVQQLSMTDFAYSLYRQTGWIVLDKTGLKGRFDLSLNYEPDDKRMSDSAPASIFAALQNQLGLKLRESKEPLEVLVIDHAEPLADEDSQAGDVPSGTPIGDFVCPMHPDVTSSKAGKCPKCAMTLKPAIVDSQEYPVDLSVTPRTPQIGMPVDLALRIKDPLTDALITNFETVHEKLFHLFMVSQDLEYFVHDHPVLRPDAAFHLRTSLPKRGIYRVLADFYPSQGTPQLVSKTIIVPGGKLEAAHPEPDFAPKQAANLQVELLMSPRQALAGYETFLFFHVTPTEGLEPYLGAWGHLLAASDDLVDLIHAHPVQDTKTASLQFNVTFPRARTYRVWVQFQRLGVVNTASFTIPVSSIE